MPRKEFESFTRLDASDVNTYLMDQSVMTFAGTAARGSAITTPVEGMVTYLEDSNSLQLYDGSGWTSAGGVSSGNAIINGAFDINQRGFTSSTASLNYMFDRWQSFAAGGTSTFSAQTFTPGAAPVSGLEFTNYLRVVTSGQSAAADGTMLRQSVEGVRNFAGQTATVSFYAKASTGTPSIAVEFNQGFGSGGSSAVLVQGQKKAISTSWNRYSYTFDIPSISGKTIGTSDTLQLQIWFSSGSDRNARLDTLGIQSNTFEVWGVQVEAGSVATPFRRNANSLQGELAACQRYYWRGANNGTFTFYGFGGATSTTNSDVVIALPTSLRINPTSVDFSAIALQPISGGGITAITSVAVLSGNSSNIAIACGVASGLTAGTSYRLLTNNSTSGFLGVSAEL
jgi:hypothetical protein